ncbi:MAG: prolyl oligopeptidase family serine peptidase [Gemmatimonadota bacterium]
MRRSAGRIKAPTLIMTNLQDFRVPPSQAFKLSHALKDNGVEVKLFGYPGRSHFPGDPVRTLDVYRRWIDWIRTQIGTGTATSMR